MLRPSPTRWAYFSAPPIMINWAGPVIFNCAQVVSCLPQVYVFICVFWICNIGKTKMRERFWCLFGGRVEDSEEGFEDSEGKRKGGIKELRCHRIPIFVFVGLHARNWLLFERMKIVRKIFVFNFLLNLKQSFFVDIRNTYSTLKNKTQWVYNFWIFLGASIQFFFNEQCIKNLKMSNV